MSKYSPEIIKAAEKLIEEHIVASQVTFQTQVSREQAIEAAIVSCKFAIKRMKTTQRNERRFVFDIKTYLEELL